MTDPNFDRQEVLDEIINRKKLGDKKFHSETSLQHFNEDAEEDVFPSKENDPGVLNTTVNNGGTPSPEEGQERRRTMSQPGPVSGGLVTATAARAARKRPLRNVAYAGDSMEQIPRLLINYRGDESGANTPTVFFPSGERKTNSPLPNNGTLRNGDAKSLNSYRMFASTNDLRGVGTPRKRSVATMDAQSLRSIETHAPPPTSPEDNKKLTKKYLTLVIGCIYATVLVTLGLIIYIGSPMVEPNIALIFSIILCCTGLLYHLYLFIDISRYKRIALKNQKTKALHEENVAEYFRKQEDDYTISTTGDRTPEMRTPAIPPAVLIPLKHDYCFSQGRHSGSFYLKMGAAGFALGHLIHSVLLLAVQIGQLIDEDVNNDECVSILQIVVDVLSPTYSFVQLYFIFKFSNVIILKAQGLAHLALMHIIGSSLCFWISAIVREIVLALTLYANTIYGEGGKNETEVEQEVDAVNARVIDISGLFNQHCDGSTALTNIQSNFSPYLYPFSVEFNILIVAIYFIIWSNVGHCSNEEAATGSVDSSSIDDTATICKIPTASEDNDFTSNIVIHADCHASNRGLFLGLIFMVFVAGMLIIGYIFSSFATDSEFLSIGYLLNDCTTLAMHVILLFAAVIACNQMRKLDINEHPVSLLDDVLLFICLPAFTLETVLSLIATISIINAVKIAAFVAMAIQVLIQTPLIMDGLRRCSNAKKLRRQKPGREVLMFLIIANVGMWLFYTFSYKSPDSLDERYEFYGKVLWSILGHVSLPLIMFYRFHSSVCFADIWNSAYKPGSEH
ncbi:hypothetical protein ABMA27_015923 [Loxostege sticticalis]|uniref:Otopetrin n=1 Tax=Loxostege sticticalis TaxID=481309 RepID=A0ABR3I4U4_LOXSC